MEAPPRHQGTGENEASCPNPGLTRDGGRARATAFARGDPAGRQQSQGQDGLQVCSGSCHCSAEQARLRLGPWKAFAGVTPAAVLWIHTQQVWHGLERGT